MFQTDAVDDNRQHKLPKYTEEPHRQPKVEIDPMQKIQRRTISKGEW
jgi:hypothetical protein